MLMAVVDVTCVLSKLLTCRWTKTEAEGILDNRFLVMVSNNINNNSRPICDE